MIYRQPAEREFLLENLHSPNPSPETQSSAPEIIDVEAEIVDAPLEREPIPVRSVATPESAPPNKEAAPLPDPDSGISGTTIWNIIVVAFWIIVTLQRCSR